MCEGPVVGVCLAFSKKKYCCDHTSGMSRDKLCQSYVGAASHDTRVTNLLGLPGLGVFWDTRISVLSLGKTQANRDKLCIPHNTEICIVL